MTDAMEALFLYAQEYLLRSLLDDDPEFYAAISSLEQQESSFRALLDGEMEERFQKFLTEQSRLNLINERAIFRAGFQVAMELSK